MFKRGGVWWTCLGVGGTRIQKSLGTPNKTLARKIEASLKFDIAEGKFFEKLPGETKTLADLRERFLAEHSRRVCPRQVKNMERHLRHFLAFAGADTPLTAITARGIIEFKQSRLMQGRKPATINREMSCLSKAFKLATNEWEWLKENPFGKVSKERENNKRHRWLSPEEEQRLLPLCPEWLREVVIFAIYTGLRRGEILQLKWPQADLQRRCVVLLKTKNHDPRTVPLADPAFEVLTRCWQKRRPKIEHVFLSVTGGAIEPARVGKVFREVLGQAGLEDFRFHDLRHTFGSRLAQAGADIFHIARLMGHKDVQTTMRYLHHNQETLSRVVRLLDRPKTYYSGTPVLRSV